MKSKDIKVGEEYGIAHSSTESRYVKIADARRVRIVENLGRGYFAVEPTDGKGAVYGFASLGVTAEPVKRRNNVVRSIQFWGTWDHVAGRLEENDRRRQRDARARADLDAEIASFLPDGFTIAFSTKEYERRALRDALEAAYEHGRASGIESESMRQ